MLTLTRSPRDGADTIIATLGDTSIRFVVAYVDGCQVRIGIDAPDSVKILREELMGDHTSVSVRSK